MTTRMEVLRPVPLPYGEGSGHTVLCGLIAEALEALELRERTIGVCSVGATFLMYDFFNVDFASAPPGRAVSVATGLKRAQPQAAVFVYQGDGDGLGAGLGDLLHAVARNEKLTIFLVNNGCLELSGGHLSPTTPLGQHARHVPEGRDAALHGTPIRACEMIAALSTPARVERVALDTPARVEAARIAVRESFRHAHSGAGTAVLEVLTASAAGEPDAGGRAPRAQAGVGPGRSPGSMRIRSPGEGTPSAEAARPDEPGEPDGEDAAARMERLVRAFPLGQFGGKR